MRPLIFTTVLLTGCPLPDPVDTDEPVETTEPTATTATLAITSPTTGAWMDEGQPVVLSAELTGLDPQGLPHTWSTSLGGTLGVVLGSPTGATSFETSDLPTGSQDITVVVTTPTGDLLEDTVHITVNGLPTAPVVHISPAAPSTEDPLTVVVDEPGEDPEGDVVSYAYTWSRDGATVTDGATVPASMTASGELWTVEVTSIDSAGATGGSTSASIEVGNAAPSIDHAWITPSEPVASDPLLCEHDDPTDPDGDPISVSYAWTIDGKAAPSIDATLAGGTASRGQEVRCTATPADPWSTGDSTQADAVTIGNTAPGPVASVVIQPDPADTSDPLSCVHGDATDDDGDPLIYAYSWETAAGVVGTDSTLPSGTLVRDDDVTCSVTPWDDRDSGPSTTSPALTIGNATPTASDVAITPDPVTAATPPSCTWMFADLDGDSDQSAVRWTIDGVSAGTSATLDVDIQRGETLECTVTPFDGQDIGSPASASVAVVNAAPSLGTVTIDPAAPVAGDTLTCSWSGFDDADGDPDASTLQWAIDGADANTSATLDTGVSGGDVVTCTVTPHDGTESGTPVVATVTVGNTAPTITEVTLDPDPPRTDAPITCSWSGFVDVDGDPDVSTAAWEVNGVDVGSGTTLPVSVTPGETVTCTVTPFDGQDAGDPMSASAVVANGVPSLASVSIAPDPPYTDDTVTATATGESDPEGDPVTLNYAWYVAGILVPGQTGTTLDGALFSRGESVQVEVTPFDGTDAGPPVWSNTLIVANSAPGAPTVGIHPSVTAPGQQDLLCTVDADAHDDDDDALTYAFTWEVDGVPFAGPTTTTVWAGDTLPADQTTTAYAAFTCSAQADDGDAVGPWSSPSAAVIVRPPAASAGDFHTCALDIDGSLACFGLGTSGQTSAPGGTGWVDVSTGGYHSCAIDSSGALDCWGYDFYGQASPPAGTWRRVSTGQAHTCAVDDAGRVECWGDDGAGQATAPAGTFELTCAGGEHSCGLLDDGSLTCWGSDSRGQATAPGGNGWIDVACGTEHSCALSSGGGVTCWGDDSDDQATDPGGAFESVSAGGYHSCAIDTDGEPSCWGSNSHGQLDLPEGPYASLDAGLYHSCGVRIDGTVVCAGMDTYGQTESGLDSVPAIAAGAAHTCAVGLDGAMTCWGDNTYGQAAASAGPWLALGTGADHTCAADIDGWVSCWGDASSGQTAGPATAGWVALTGGVGHSCGMDDGGALSCWGDDTYGQASAPGGTFTAVDAGDFHSCGLSASGAVDCWGDNTYGQVSSPGDVFLDVSAGGMHTCGVIDDGTLTCWGDDTYGQATAPTGTYVAVAAGARHTCAIQDDGTATCWGDGSLGETDAPAGTVLISLAAGDGLTCAIATYGWPTCWGDDTYGQVSGTR